MNDRIEILRCPHGAYSIGIGNGQTSRRVAGSKCCGQWNTVNHWTITDHVWSAIVESIPLKPFRVLERRYVIGAIERIGSKAKTARLLQIDRRTLYRKLARWEQPT